MFRSACSVFFYCSTTDLFLIVAVVDAINITRYLADKEVCKEAARQVLIADKILLNKCDIASEEQQRTALEAIMALNPSVDVLPTQFSQVQDLRSILFMNTTKSLPTSLTEHLHHDGNKPSITSVPIEFSSPNDVWAVSSVSEIMEICKALLYPAATAEEGETEDVTFEVIRCKAAIWVREGEGCPATFALYQLQCIGDLFDVVKMEGQSVPYGSTRVLVLGKHLSENRLRGIFMKHLRPIHV